MARVISSKFLPLLVLFAHLPARSEGAQAPAFEPRPSHELVLPAFTDADVTRLLTTLDVVLADDLPPAEWRDAAKTRLWDFVRRLQDGRLTAEQERLVLGHLQALELAHPESAPVLSETQRAVATLTVGKPAPDIVGAALDGSPLRLSDFRGKVVVLKFGGAWCAICRSEYPYERFLLELYAGWPLAILGVDSSETSEAAREGHSQYGLSYPTWWDGRSGDDDRGPIAAAWNVRGWPTSYVLDAEGVIRFVDLRAEDLLKAVRQLLVEEQRRLLKPGGGGPPPPR